MSPATAGSKNKLYLSPALSLSLSDFLLGTFFYHDNGGDMFSEASVDLQRTMWRHISDDISLSNCSLFRTVKL